MTIKRKLLIGGAVFAAALASAPVPAMSLQEAAPTSGGQTRLVDPDEQADRLADRTTQQAVRGTYDRESARSIMEYGNQAPATGFGAGYGLQPFGF